MKGRISIDYVLIMYFPVQLLFKLSISASDAPNKKLLKVS